MIDHATRAEIDRLRSELQHLRKDPQYFEQNSSQKTLIDSMERLHGVLEKLITLFETANKEVYAEYDKGFHEESEKLDKLLEQNEKIARGIVALADMMKTQRAPAPAIQQPTMPKASFPPDEHVIMPPKPAAPQPLPALSLPPMPPLAAPTLPPLPEPKAPPRRGILEKFSFK